MLGPFHRRRSRIGFSFSIRAETFEESYFCPQELRTRPRAGRRARIVRLQVVEGPNEEVKNCWGLEQDEIWREKRDSSKFHATC